MNVISHNFASEIAYRRMHRLIRKILSVFIAIIVLTATSGFNIYKHHCNHHGYEYYTLSVSPGECCSGKSTSNETPARENSCCSVTDTENSCSSQPGEESKCCDTFSEFFKIENPFSKPVVQELSFVVVIVKDFYLPEEDLQTDHIELMKDPDRVFRSGKDLVYLLKQARLAPPIA